MRAILRVRVTRQCHVRYELNNEVRGLQRINIYNRVLYKACNDKQKQTWNGMERVSVDTQCSAGYPASTEGGSIAGHDTTHIKGIISTGFVGHTRRYLALCVRYGE